VAGRLARVDPTNAIVYQNYTFPPGTIVSMTIRDMHTDPDCHYSPEKFDPERWLNPGTQKRAEQFFAPYGKGSRSCLGRDLAQLEIMIVTATLLSKFAMQLYQTTDDDIKPYHLYFSPFPRVESKGLQVTIS